MYPENITRSHSSNEYITIEELWEGFKTYCLIAMDFVVSTNGVQS